MTNTDMGHLWMKTMGLWLWNNSSGWWFQTWIFIVHNIYIYIIFISDNPSHWRTHIFQRGRSTTNQLWVWEGLRFCSAQSASNIFKQVTRFTLVLTYPLAMTKITTEHGPFIVDLPIKKCDFPSLFKRLPEGIIIRYHWWWNLVWTIHN